MGREFRFLLRAFGRGKKNEVWRPFGVRPARRRFGVGEAFLVRRGEACCAHSPPPLQAACKVHQTLYVWAACYSLT